MSVSGVNVELDELVKTVQRMKDAMISIETTKKSIQVKYAQLGQSWTDKKYIDLRNTLGECNSALNNVHKTLLQGEKAVLYLIKSIQDYEALNLEGPRGKNGFHGASEEENNSTSSTLSESDAITHQPQSITPLSTEEAMAAVKSEGKAWADGLQDGEKDSVTAYTGSAYSNINAVLRGKQSDFEGNNHENAVNIHRALSRSSIPCDCMVYRGASPAALGIYQNLPDDQLVGNIIRDDAFMSTSIDPDTAFENTGVRLEISVPAGAHGAYVGDISHYGHLENEVLFDCGQRLQITGVRRDEWGQRIISARMMLE